MAGNIARALSVFCIDEVIVFSDGNDASPAPRYNAGETSGDGYTGTTDPGHFLAQLLSYLETPPHLRKRLFPLHPNLRTAGTLPSLDLPHHVKPDEWCTYREGVTLPGADENGTFVEAGLRIPVTVAEERIPPDTRVTLRFDEEAERAAGRESGEEVIFAEAVGAEEPREVGGYYWGYSVRRAKCLSDVFTECGFEGGYDVSIGTS
jgi:predicted SPOUT superfamily RNA methylase MTH1